MVISKLLDFTRIKLTTEESDEPDPDDPVRIEQTLKKKNTEFIKKFQIHSQPITTLFLRNSAADIK